MVSVFAMVGDTPPAGAAKALAAGLADRGPAALVLVVGGDIADAGVQAHGVVAVLGGGELAAQVGGVGEAFELGVVVLEVAEEALDVRLVGGDAGAPAVGGDRVERHELAGGARGHLRPVV